MIKSQILLLFTVFFTSFATYATDVLTFGNVKSEVRHEFADSLTESYVGELKESARRMCPDSKIKWKGGWMRFRMKVDPGKQNYFTVRCWGSESDNSIVMLFIDGLQIGYRHLGDLDLLHRGNGQKPCIGRYYYYTIPLPIKHTRGKTVVDLELRSYGNTWDYGNTFESYQKNMEAPTIGFYKAYVTTEPCFPIDWDEKQNSVDVSRAPQRQFPGVEQIDNLKRIISERIDDIIDKKTPLGQQEIWFLADAYSVGWTPIYNDRKAVDKVTDGIDSHFRKYAQNPDIIHSDPSVYNSDWMTASLIARSIRALWNELSDRLDVTVDNENIRRSAWSRLMKGAIDYGITHRRHYTNQSIIIDMAIYECNRALMLLNPQQALPEYQTLRYLYESLALAPWLGKETANGPEKPLGDNYWQLTDKGLTKELGYVGYYGEVLDWVNQVYKATSTPGVHDSGDPKIKHQLLRMADARYNFRYPALDNDGYRCFRAEAVIGWRDGNHYPGDVMYGDRGSAWDATPFMTAAMTRDPKAIAIAKDMLDDNQFYAMVEHKLADAGNIRSLHSCLHLPDELSVIKESLVEADALPMSHNAPDYVFADEEDGVVAIKNGNEILYASLYWRARNGVNNLAKVHYITPQNDRIANVCVESKFTDSGMRFVRPDWVNLGFVGFREWYDGIHSAHTGEELPIAMIPSDVKFKPGDENAYAGKADFYVLKYGNYIIGMNCSVDKSFDMDIPQGKKIRNLTDQTAISGIRTMRLHPRSTVALYLED